jgi:hypothetical protein
MYQRILGISCFVSGTIICQFMDAINNWPNLIPGDPDMDYLCNYICVMGTMCLAALLLWGMDSKRHKLNYFGNNWNDNAMLACAVVIFGLGLLKLGGFTIGNFFVISWWIQNVVSLVLVLLAIAWVVRKRNILED